MKPAILTDVTKCIGCNECVRACKNANRLGPDLPRRWTLDDGLSSRNWCSVVEGPAKAHVRKQCRHCLEPACASACPVGALVRSGAGPVIYHPERCMGCRYCMMACPYGIPRYDWEQAVPYVRKCTLCSDRLREGLQPACTAACPVKATIFGDRGELLAEAHARIRGNPARYQQRIWGETDAGGTSVLYISHVDLAFLTSGQDPGPRPLPETTHLAMHAVPFVFTGVVAGMAGLRWVIERRRKLEGSHE